MSISRTDDHNEQSGCLPWRRQLAASTRYAVISDDFLTSVRIVHRRLGLGDEPTRSSIERVLATMEDENIFGLGT